ncbi:MAG: hypothetical protein NT007_09710 [Candidatus Kapabacteria bacterium]|nr:hypothetical protein [Candidatus Kapabacteria bacterium]
MAKKKAVRKERQPKSQITDRELKPLAHGNKTPSTPVYVRSHWRKKP